MSTIITTLSTGQATSTLGNSVPPFTSHAISVSLPTWRDVVGYEEGEKRVVDAMVTGYPRFFIHKSIQKLAGICERKFGFKDEACLLCPSLRIADHCRSFLIDRAEDSEDPISVRLVQFLIEDIRPISPTTPPPSKYAETPASSIELHAVFCHTRFFPLARQFWQHTGLGISSRLAERCLALLDASSQTPPTSPATGKTFSKLTHRHYSVKAPIITSVPHKQSLPPADILDAEQGVYIEERYGRNLPLSSAASAKRALRRRIAGVLVHDNQQDCPGGPCAGEADAELGPSSRGVENVTEDDVFLFPSGMSAIWSAHQLALATRPAAKSVCFGFPYTDTLKILQKWGPGCHFFGHGQDADIDVLEALLAERAADHAHTPAPPILALFCEFPSNPLLRSPNLPRLRALADKYDFLIVVDETVGNFVNVAVLPFADIVVSSLTKVFSGDSNVMGGSLILNPRSRHFAALKSTLAASYEDVYFAEDAIFMERNSRDFKKRIQTINVNAEAVCDFLRARSLAASPTPVVKDVYYPKWVTRANFDVCRPHTAPSDHAPNFGGLFSVTFTSAAASEAFFDALPCSKGPSLGTNFTLACPYTVLAHYAEMEWAQSYGVEESLVRVSVGLEDKEVLIEQFGVALRAAEQVGEVNGV